MSVSQDILAEMTTGYLPEMRVVVSRSQRVRAKLVDKTVGIRQDIANLTGTSIAAKRERMDLRRNLSDLKECISRIDSVIYSINQVHPQ